MSQREDGFLVLYDCRMDFRSALAVGIAFFQRLGLEPNEMACGIIRRGRNLANVKSIGKIEGFESFVDNEGLAYLVLAKQAAGNSSAHVTFYYGHDEIHHDFYRLIVAYRADQLPGFDIEGLVQTVVDANMKGKVPYGFSTRIPLNELTQYEYADAQALFVPFLPYEDPDRWKVEVPTYMSEEPSPRRYLLGMLRLVYEWNFLSSKHLGMPIAGHRLEEWIGAEPSRGTLEKLGNDLWAWKVNPEHLADVNEACAKAGLLVAWQQFTPPQKSVKRLP